MCETESGQNYLLKGDAWAFLDDAGTSSGNLKLTVPSIYVNHTTITIDTDMLSEHQISTAYHNRRLHERNLQQIGQKRVIVVRISDPGESNDFKRVKQSSWELSQDIFHDENNLVSQVSRAHFHDKV